jgi:hypothetical protein
MTCQIWPTHLIDDHEISQHYYRRDDFFLKKFFIISHLWQKLAKSSNG